VELSDSKNPLDSWCEEDTIERQKQTKQTEPSCSSTCCWTDDTALNSWHRN